MDPLAFLTWQFVMFSLFVSVIMFVIRTVLEYFVPKLKTLKIWNSLLLLLLPVFIGATLGGLLKMYPYATGLTTTVEHVGYGSVAGMMSTILFKIIKELLINKVTSIFGGIGGQPMPPQQPPGGMMGVPPQPPPMTADKEQLHK